MKLKGRVTKIETVYKGGFLGIVARIVTFDGTNTRVYKATRFEKIQSDAMVQAVFAYETIQIEGAK